MTRTLTLSELTPEAFAPYGDLIQLRDSPDAVINAGMCARHHDLARLDFADGRAGISVFDAKARVFPHLVDLVERHPLGSQAFLPMTANRFLVVVADDENGEPVDPKAFVTAPGQGVNYMRGVWHGVLTPLDGAGRFVVVDRVGEGVNLEEHRFEEPYLVEAS